MSAKALFILFGNVAHIVQAFPAIEALQKKFGCETSWLTSPEHAAIARASLCGLVYETKACETIPWEWIHEQRFTHVFFPEPAANREEWERSGLHAIEFIGRKCGVEIESRRGRFNPSPEAIAEAEAFLRQNGLLRNEFITAFHGDGNGRHWPKSNLMKITENTDLRVVVFGKKGDGEILHTISCIDKTPEVMAVLIAWSRFYLGSANSTSWLATMTDTPMGVFYDSHSENGWNSLSEALHGEKSDIQEWDIYTNLQTVIEHIERRVGQVCVS